MTYALPALSTFFASEDGAVTVDWVVLTAGAVGIGLAVMTVVSNGVGNLSASIVDGLEAVGDIAMGAAQGLLSETDFSDGAGGWIGGAVATLPGFGDVLQLGGGEYAQLQLDVPDGASSATVSFDIIGGDDLDGEPATIFVNGQEVSVYSDDHGNVSVSNADVSGVSVSVDQTYTNSSAGGGTHGRDSRATYTITVDNPGSNLTVGVSSGADQGTSNEFYAIDDVSVTSS